ncbi:hypothetical protein ACLOJK_006273 [Asimina triloba]
MVVFIRPRGDRFVPKSWQQKSIGITGRRYSRESPLFARIQNVDPSILEKDKVDGIAVIRSKFSISWDAMRLVNSRPVFVRPKSKPRGGGEAKKHTRGTCSPGFPNAMGPHAPNCHQPNSTLARMPTCKLCELCRRRSTTNHAV